MSAKAKQKQHEIFVKKENLTSQNLSPTSIELFEMMHLTSCEHAIKRWKEEWITCPVCSQPFQYGLDSYGIVAMQPHKQRKDILV